MTLATGTKLGPYEIGAPLGAGGMGEVYRARDTRLGRDVAVKVLPAGSTSNADSRSRLEREARAISSLNHPHICTLHDVGRQGDTDYLVMELVEGETLADRLKRGALPTELLLRTAIEIADALEKAHRAGIVHRDLKPGNIMLTKSGAKLMDFGLARATGLAPGTSESSQSPTMSRPLTAEGTIVGTFQYMAPEQLEGKEADARSDLWALGAVLYEAATGRKAFEGRSQASLIAAIMHTEPPPIATLAPMTPPGLDRLVRACLAKDPDDRIQTAHDARMQLEWVRDAGSQAGVPAPVSAARRGRERALALVIGAIVLVVGVAAAWLVPLAMRRTPPPVMRFSVGAPPGVTMIPDPAHSAISPDGRTLVFAATDSAGIQRLWLRPISSLSVQPIEGSDNGGFPFWSPDSRALAFFADGKLKRVTLGGGGAPDVLCDAPDARGGSWSKGGVIVFAPMAAGSLFRVSTDGGQPVEIMRPDSARGETGLRWPEFLPDGKHYLFTSLPEHEASFDVYSAALDSRQRKKLLIAAASPVYASPGYLLFVRNGRLVAQRFNAGSLKLTGKPATLGEAPPPSGSLGARSLGASSNGIIVQPAGGIANTRLEWWDRPGHTTGILAAPAGRYEGLRISHDGKRLVAARRSSPSTMDLWMIELSRPVATRFTFDGAGQAFNPIWSPDDQWVAYNSGHTGSGNIYRKRADGTGEPELLLESQELFNALSHWTPDGKFLVYNQPNPTTGWDVWLLPVDGDHKPVPYLHSRFNEYSGSVSPDGHWITYSSDESGREEIYVQSFPTPGNKYQVTSNGGFISHWSASGRELGIGTPDGTIMMAEVKTTPTFSTSTPHKLFKLRPDIAAVGATEDLQHYLMSLPEGDAAPPALALTLNWTSALKR